MLYYYYYSYSYYYLVSCSIYCIVHWACDTGSPGSISGHVSQFAKFLVAFFVLLAEVTDVILHSQLIELQLGIAHWTVSVALLK